jgi:hypothetical protein
MFNISFIILRDLESFVSVHGGEVTGLCVKFESIPFHKMQEMESEVYTKRIGATKSKQRVS